ncbi:MAG TPA: hypothetical protein VJ124_27080 [Pyrinomonadaceae bacterium]|nr:hypothetical protein [Pyrinomonadaceae bacterium]
MSLEPKPPGSADYVQITGKAMTVILAKVVNVSSEVFVERVP